MNTNTMLRFLLPAMLAAAPAGQAAAQTAPDARARHAGMPAVPAGTTIPRAARPAVDVVDRFGAALADGDLKTVGELLAPSVLILESGGAERSREEYLGHHAAGDAAFLKRAQRRITHRTAHASGDMAWVGTESELTATREGKPATTLSTETMVLARTPKGWRIVHVHWSSRPKP